MYKDMGMESGPGGIDEQEVVIVFPEIFSLEEMDKFKEESHGLINSGKIYITLDFRKCEFIDSTGLGAIVAIHKKCRQALGRLRIVAVSPPVMKLFEITRLNRLFLIEQKTG